MAKPTCKIEDCEEPVCARGWCHRHYRIWRRNGDPLVVKNTVKLGLTLEERFWSKTNKDGPVPEYRPDLGPCWIWTAALNAYGYGKFSMGGKNGRILGAHTVSYKMLVGPVPEGLELDHLCRVRACVNPSHLEPVTSAENMRRMMLARTHCDQGHLFDEANTSWYRGNRRCRACSRDAARLKRQRPAVAGIRSISVTVKLSAADAALIDGARDRMGRSTWMRTVVLAAAERGVSAAGRRDRQDGMPRTIEVHILTAPEELERIDAARGDVLRGIWVRRVALAAAFASAAA
jgi:hypothetical protein